MSFFDDIGNAIGSAVGGITSVANDIVNSPVGQIGLTVAGTALGDPTLAAEAGGVLRTATAAEKLFGIGGGAIKSRNIPGAGLLPRAPATRWASAQTVTVAAAPTLRWHGVPVTKAQLKFIISFLHSHRHAPSLASPPPPPPPVVLPPAPRPPPVVAATPAIVSSLLSNTQAISDAVASGAPIIVGGKLVQPDQPIVLPPALASVAADIAVATGLNVVVPPDNSGDTSGGSHRNTDL